MAIVTTMLTLIATAVVAAVIMTGTSTTPARHGKITFTPARAFRGGGTGLVWYYGVSGIMADNALVTLQPDGTYGGPIWFFDRKGTTTDAGTTTVAFN